MERARLSEEQVVTALREHGVGAKADSPARKHGISEATLYNWWLHSGGMDVSDKHGALAHLRALTDLSE